MKDTCQNILCVDWLEHLRDSYAGLHMKATVAVNNRNKQVLTKHNHTGTKPLYIWGGGGLASEQGDHLRIKKDVSIE